MKQQEKLINKYLRIERKMLSLEGMWQQTLLEIQGLPSIQ